jgi:hypothetical protein
MRGGGEGILARRTLRSFDMGLRSWVAQVSGSDVDVMIVARLGMRVVGYRAAERGWRSSTRMYKMRRSLSKWMAVKWGFDSADMISEESDRYWTCRYSKNEVAFGWKLYVLV